jgi:hypothetical protein
MSRRLKLGAKSEIENMCIAFWCLTSRQKFIELELLSALSHTLKLEVIPPALGVPFKHFFDSVEVLFLIIKTDLTDSMSYLY